MVVFRFLAAVFLLIAVIKLVDDLTPALASRSALGAGAETTAEFKPKSLEAQWTEIAPSSLIAAKNAVSAATAPWVWESLVVPVLGLPTFAAFGGLALLSGYVGRRRRKVEIFIN